MAVAVKTMAIKARAMEGSEARFRDGIKATAVDVSKSTVPLQSAEVPRSKTDVPRSVSEPEHCTKDSL